MLGFPSADDAKGSVVVWYGSGSVEEWTRETSGVLDTADPGDYWGDAVVAADVDGDGYDDLIVGVPGDDVGSVEGRRIDPRSVRGQEGTDGRGRPDPPPGLDGDQWAWRIAHDSFGEALTAGDFDCDGYADVAIGVPQEDHPFADPDSRGAERDLWELVRAQQRGRLLSPELERRGRLGATPGTTSGLRLRPETSTTDTHNGNDCDDLAIGVPGEDFGGGATRDAGRVVVFYGDSTGISGLRKR